MKASGTYKSAVPSCRMKMSSSAGLISHAVPAVVADTTAEASSATSMAHL